MALRRSRLFCGPVRSKFPLILIICFPAVNIAVALAKKFQLKVGLLDADIYGPSIPTMMNLHAKPEVSEGICHITLKTCNKVHNVFFLNLDATMLRFLATF